MSGFNNTDDVIMTDDDKPPGMLPPPRPAPTSDDSGLLANPGPSIHIGVPHPSFATYGGPSYPTYGGPSYPTSGGPSYPTYGGPSYPTYGGPSYPTSGGPSYPTSRGPSYPTYGGPSYPTYGGPSYATGADVFRSQPEYWGQFNAGGVPQRDPYDEFPSRSYTYPMAEWMRPSATVERSPYETNNSFPNMYRAQHTSNIEQSPYETNNSLPNTFPNTSGQGYNSHQEPPPYEATNTFGSMFEPGSNENIEQSIYENTMLGSGHENNIETSPHNNSETDSKNLAPEDDVELAPLQTEALSTLPTRFLAQERSFSNVPEPTEEDFFAIPNPTDARPLVEYNHLMDATVATAVPQIKLRDKKRKRNGVNYSFRCPICLDVFSRRETVKDGHFIRCVEKRGNPENLPWDQDKSCWYVGANGPSGEAALGTRRARTELGHPERVQEPRTAEQASLLDPHHPNDSKADKQRGAVSEGRQNRRHKKKKTEDGPSLLPSFFPQDAMGVPDATGAHPFPRLAGGSTVFDSEQAHASRGGDISSEASTIPLMARGEAVNRSGFSEEQMSESNVNMNLHPYASPYPAVHPPRHPESTLIDIATAAGEAMMSPSRNALIDPSRINQERMTAPGPAVRRIPLSSRIHETLFGDPGHYAGVQPHMTPGQGARAQIVPINYFERQFVQPDTREAFTARIQAFEDEIKSRIETARAEVGVREGTQTAALFGAPVAQSNVLIGELTMNQIANIAIKACYQKASDDAVAANSIWNFWKSKMDDGTHSDTNRIPEGSSAIERRRRVLWIAQDAYSQLTKAADTVSKQLAMVENFKQIARWVGDIAGVNTIHRMIRDEFQGSEELLQSALQEAGDDGLFGWLQDPEDA